ncbi:PXMP2/4 family protein 1 [Vitis vinifera]|uniref:PXMP2/4 family protein 1 n=1 Tax=Vitis vinifera TaxID=29760 RepID=A0A438H6U7_VITVI|nr:PXMP2/4 family protein 1 [Vitis vinifera]
MRGVFLKNGLVHRFSQICKSADAKNPFLIPRDRDAKGSHHYHNFLNKSRESASGAFSIPFSSSSSPSRSRVGFVAWYLGLVQSRPLLTKSVTSSLIYAAADCTSQTISRQSTEPYDFMRTLRMAGYGMLILGPSLHFWFNFMSKVLPQRDLITTLKKICLGQTTFGPFMTAISSPQMQLYKVALCLFFMMVNSSELSNCLPVSKMLEQLARGCAFITNENTLVRLEPEMHQGLNFCENGSDIIARLNRDLIPTLINGVMYWPLCDFVTFKFIPVHLQPLVSNSFSYLWTIYMTYMASLERADTQ